MLNRREVPILIVNLIYIPIFAVVALRRLNYEFLLYVAVILVVGALVLWKQASVRFAPAILWGLTIWGLMHMSGGIVPVSDGVLYGVQLIPLSARHHILRYDQLVHMFGFGLVTLIAYHLLQPYLRQGIEHRATLYVLVVLMGSGFGALNEIIEFIAVLTMPQTGVGGYDNTLWDLVFNLFGGIIAVTWIAARRPGVSKVDARRALA